ncbi:translation initiation factor IF-2 N-terminal domain-containing protein, partial [Desulfovibrio sp.]
MSDSKIKIKDLATELKMDAKELLQELQSMGFNVKSAQGSIPMEEVSGVRDRVAENRQRKAGRKDDQPTVIVRRRRVKDEAPAAEQPVAGTRAEAAPEKAPDPAAPVETPAARVISVPEPEKAPGGKPEPVKVEPKAEKTPEPVAPVETPAVRVVAAPEAEKAPEAKPEPVKNETKADPRTEAKREARVEKATPRTARVVAPAGARVISRPDATPTARVIRPAQADAPVTGTENKPGAKPEKTPEA